MSDITKCSGDGCPWKNKCFRFLVPNNPEYQSSFIEIPGKYIDEVFSCEFIWTQSSEFVMNQLTKIVTGEFNKTENED